jgi:mono/diheme cytochrome c family protein
MSSNARDSLRVVVLGVGLAAVLTIPAAAQQISADAVTNGAAVYGDMCGRCHSPRSPLERTDRDWVTIVNHMRVRANLTGAQARSVLAFLQATNSDAEAPAPRATAGTTGGESLATGPLSSDPRVIATGQQLVQTRGCIGCHVAGASGGRLGPALNGVVGRRGAEFVRQKLADPVFSNPTTAMPNFHFTRAEIEAIAAYLNTLQGR